MNKQIWYEIITENGTELRGGPVPKRIDSSLEARARVRALRTLNPDVKIGLRSITQTIRNLAI
jgi:hypothetical protein